MIPKRPCYRCSRLLVSKNTQMTKIVDAFTFFNEVELLCVRLEELYSVVDYFVIVESAQTFAGKAKPFYLDSHTDFLRPFADKIKVVKLRTLPPLIEDTEVERFRLEAFQRNAIMYGLLDLDLAPEDIIIISDVDEIPKQSYVSKGLIEALDHFDAAALMLKYHKHYLDCRVADEHKRPWIGPVAARFSFVAFHSPQQLRRKIAKSGEFYSEVIHGQIKNVRFIKSAGWHLTYFGGREVHDYKLVSFAHGASYSKGLTSKPVCMAKENMLADIVPFWEAEASIHQFVYEHLNQDVPIAILEKLNAYYHLFGQVYLEKPSFFELAS